MMFSEPFNKSMHYKVGPTQCIYFISEAACFMDCRPMWFSLFIPCYLCCDMFHRFLFTIEALAFIFQISVGTCW